MQGPAESVYEVRLYQLPPRFIHADFFQRAATSRFLSHCPRTTLSSRLQSASRPRSTTPTYPTTTAVRCAWACYVPMSGSRRTRSRMFSHWSGLSSLLLSRMMRSKQVLRTSSRTTRQHSRRRRRTGWTSTQRVRRMPQSAILLATRKPERFCRKAAWIWRGAESFKTT